MPDVITLYNTLTGTSLPNILVITGIIFLFLAIVGQFAWKIRIGRKQQMVSGVLGVIFLGFGVLLYIPPQNSPSSVPVSTPTPTSTPVITPSIQDEKSVDIEPIVGVWRGRVGVGYDDSTMQVLVTIEEPCKLGSICGTIDLSELECTMRLKLEDVNDGVYTFSREKWQGYCSGVGGDTFRSRGANQVLWAVTSGELEATLQRVNQ